MSSIIVNWPEVCLLHQIDRITNRYYNKERSIRNEDPQERGLTIMVGNIQHQSRRGAEPHYSRQRANTYSRKNEATHNLARQMLEEGRELTSRRDGGAQFTLEMPRGYPDVSQSNLMFSLLILAPMYGLRAGSYEGDTFTFTKL
jgi:hypothetical protein